MLSGDIFAENYPRTKDPTILSRATEQTEEEYYGDVNMGTYTTPGRDTVTTDPVPIAPPVAADLELNTSGVGSMDPTGTIHRSSNVTSVTPLKSVSRQDPTPTAVQLETPIEERSEEDLKVTQIQGEGQTDISHSGSEGDGPGFVSQVTVAQGKKSTTDEIKSDITLQDSVVEETVQETAPEASEDSQPQTSITQEEEVNEEEVNEEQEEVSEVEVKEEQKETETQEEFIQEETTEEISEIPKTPKSQERMTDGATGKVTLSRKASHLSNAPSIMEEPEGEEEGAMTARGRFRCSAQPRQLTPQVTAHPSF